MFPYFNRRRENPLQNPSRKPLGVKANLIYNIVLNLAIQFVTCVNSMQDWQISKTTHKR